MATVLTSPRTEPAPQRLVLDNITFDYDGRNDSVSFRSADSFVASLNEASAAAADWNELRTDYYIDTETTWHKL